jgi:SAM-dependent methyltransferase
MKQLLNFPIVYRSMQSVGGFFSARVKAIDEFLVIKEGTRIIDIGCGPGNIIEYLPNGIDYVGFDIDDAYINYANKHYHKKGRFFCRYFDAAAAKEFAHVDIVMMNGVLHHISDHELNVTLQNVSLVLKRGGQLLSLDGCYREGQSALRKWLLDNDRGTYVRDLAGYRKVLKSAFNNVDLHLREEYSRVPYTFAVGLSSNTPRT